MRKRTPQEQHDRDKGALKQFLVGRKYPEPLAALGIAEKWHVGYRKDKETPELHHQVGVTFNFLNTPIDGLTRAIESACIAALLCHDVVEDYPVTYDDLRNGGLTQLAVLLVKGLTKIEGESQAEMHARLLSHWLLPILKGCDRDNNVMTMQGAFSLEKMRSYILETRTVILYVLKEASRIYPEHYRSYTVLAANIKKQLRIYEGFIQALEAHVERELSLQAEIGQLMLRNGDLASQLAAAKGFPASLLEGANPATEVIDNPGKVIGSKTIFVTD